MTIASPATLVTRQMPRWNALCVGVIVVAFVAAFGGAMQLLVSRWYHDDFYSYAFLIPAISGYMLWMQRDAVRSSLGPADYRVGIPFLALGLLGLLVGRAGSFGVLQMLSLVPAVAGIVALCAGRRALVAAWMPLSYLLLAVPIWDVFTDPVHEPFQLLSARLGHWLMTAVGVPAYLDDRFLYLPNITLEVARACSGVNYLISVVAIAIPYGYLTLSSMSRRIGVVSFAVVVAILSNGIRVALIGALQYYRILEPADLHGPAHMLQGMFVAVFGFLALFVGARLLREPHPARSHAAPSFVGPARPVLPLWKPTGVIVVLLGLAGFAAAYSDPRPVPLADSAWWPATIGEWRMNAGDPGTAPLRAARPDAEFSREYRTGRGHSIAVYIAYFARQEDGRKLMGFGGVTLPEWVDTVELRTSSERAVRVATLGSTSRFGRTRYTLAWYDVDGLLASDVYRAKLATMWNSVVHRRSNGAFVSLTFSGEGLTREESEAELRLFAANLLPLIRGFLAGVEPPR